jgi:hypothetical protein
MRITKYYNKSYVNVAKTNINIFRLQLTLVVESGKQNCRYGGNIWVIFKGMLKGSLKGMIGREDAENRLECVGTGWDETLAESRRGGSWQLVGSFSGW